MDEPKVPVTLSALKVLLRRYVAGNTTRDRDSEAALVRIIDDLMERP